MFKILTIFKDIDEGNKMASSLKAGGYAVSLLQEIAPARKALEEDPFDLIVLDLTGHTLSSPDIRQMASRAKEKGIPILLLLSPKELASYDYVLGLEDFALKPATPTELIARIKQIRWRKSQVDTKEVIKRGDLVIDLARFEAYLSGKALSLAFKEFELLRFLASNSGRVFSRDTLLDKVWGYDYYGGTRTVDVHIRRLRSKIEDSNHSFIETVRNVGYRFKES